MLKKKYKIRSEVWLYPGMAGWHFVSVPKKQAEEIKKNFNSKKRGWGSLPVVASIGKTEWRTSIFPDKRTSTYLMPLKVEVRKKEGIMNSDTIIFNLEIKA